jgi:hypothetical protein
MKLKDLNRQLPESELCKLGRLHKTDKPGNGYTKLYYELFKEFRNDPVHFFEIGIYFGASIKMWHDFFPNGKIYGIDNGRIVPGTGIHVGKNNEFPSIDDINLLQNEAIVKELKYPWLENDRIRCYTADQRSKHQLTNACSYFNCNEFDIILDDGHHFQEHQQKSLGILFPTIKSGKYYIIEDVVTYESLTNNNTYWGQRKKDATDSTDYIFTEFIKTGNLKSQYLTEDQLNYIKNNIEDIYMYDCLNKNNSPINGNSKVLVIKKK